MDYDDYGGLKEAHVKRYQTPFPRKQRGVLAEGMDSMPMKVFISHISGEAALASVLRGWIESTFLGQVDVFVSEHDISSGEQWFQRLGEELTDAKAMLVLCSERSISRPWINFEAGAGHVKGIPVIPICYAGVRKDTLPAPLFFFQGLDVEAEDFGVKVIGDLAQHLGYARTPVIRHEDMTAAVKEALSQIGDPSGNNVIGDLGFVDHLVLFTEKTEELNNLISEFGESTNEMTIGTSKFSDQAGKAGNNPSSGTPQNLQRIARQFGQQLSAYGGNIEDLNRKYGEIFPEIKSSLQRVLTYQDLDPTSGKDGVDEFLGTLDEMEQGVLAWKDSVVETKGTMDMLPNFQREMRRGARKVIEQFETLTSNLDDTLDMIQEARATCISRQST